MRVESFHVCIIIFILEFNPFYLAAKTIKDHRKSSRNNYLTWQFDLIHVDDIYTLEINIPEPDDNHTNCGS